MGFCDEGGWAHKRQLIPLKHRICRKEKASLFFSVQLLSFAQSSDPSDTWAPRTLLRGVRNGLTILTVKVMHALTEAQARSWDSISTLHIMYTSF